MIYDYIMVSAGLLLLLLTYASIKKQTKKLLEQECRITELNRENIQLKLKLVPIEVSQRY